MKIELTSEAVGRSEMVRSPGQPEDTEVVELMGGVEGILIHDEEWSHVLDTSYEEILSWLRGGERPGTVVEPLETVEVEDRR